MAPQLSTSNIIHPTNYSDQHNSSTYRRINELQDAIPSALSATDAQAHALLTQAAPNHKICIAELVILFSFPSNIFTYQKAVASLSKRGTTEY
jgi:hypothetical protein